MSKSLEFCKRIVSNKDRSFFADRDWTNAIEIDSEKIFTNVLKDCRNWLIRRELEDGTKIDITIYLTITVVKGGEIINSFCKWINPEAEFDYFTSSSSVHDGTLVFKLELINDYICNVICGKTYNKNMGEPKSNNTVHYIVGNLVVLNEYDMDHNKFCSKDKPFLCERTTVLLPIRMSLE